MHSNQSWYWKAQSWIYFNVYHFLHILIFIKNYVISGLLFSAYAFADQSIYGGNNFPVGIAGGNDDLSESVPGNPGQDYPIFSEVPDTSFVCDGQVIQTH